MRKFWLLIWIIGLQIMASQAHARQVLVDSLRYWTAPDYTRLVFDVSAAPVHEVFLLENPPRLVIDFSNARLNGPLIKTPATHSLFSRIRSASRNENDLRVVVDLKRTINPKSFALKPNKQYGHRLVVDLLENKKAVASTSKPKSVDESILSGTRDIVIAIDAGHGGEDPGARGSHGTQEKKVVLAIAKKLEALLKKQPGMKPIMIRKGDYYVGLRKRMKLARLARADLFVSIHADAFKNPRVKGASVFTLSRRGATSEAARWLANNENAADLVGGVSLDDKDDLLASVLLDLSQTATQEASVDVASHILKNFGEIGKLHSKSVQKAGFVVLKSPDIPSILVETAFISNPSEEKKLRSHRHQAKMAKAIFNGIMAYFQRNPPPGTRMATAPSKHVISRGETLSGIAVQYGVSMKELKKINSLPGNTIRIGQVLSIPKS